MTAPAPEPVVPVVRAEALGLRGPEGPVFADVTLPVWPATLTVLLGPAGSGRSALLLALSGRMRGCTGVLLVGPDDRPAGRRELRRLRSASAVARLGDLVVPEDRLDVASSVAERALIDGVAEARAEAAFAAAEELLDVRFERSALVERLGGYERTALAVALALLRPADLVVLDDLDADLDLADQRRLLAALARLARTGPAVLVSSTETTAVPPGAVTLHLPGLAGVPAPELPSPSTTPADPAQEDR